MFTICGRLRNSRNLEILEIYTKHRAKINKLEFKFEMRTTFLLGIISEKNLNLMRFMLTAVIINAAQY